MSSELWGKRMGANTGTTGLGALDALPPEYADAEVMGDCSYEREHQAHHVTNPETGRFVCQICHPMPGGRQG